MAGKIPQNVIEEIREKTNIVEIVGQYVQLRKSGKNYLGLCPFHNEKSPSFSVAEDKQIFHCFGCGKGGNVFSFIQEIDGLTFPEAVVKVAELEQIPLAEHYQQVQTSEVESSQKQQLIACHEKAAEVYHHLLMNTTVGQQAYEYLLKRGLTEELIATFQIGFAPEQRQVLQQILKNEKFTDELLGQTGLFIERDDGQLLDRFYQRIMFPIRNPQGKTIGFSGRFLPQGEGANQPKYLNSPETLLFNKRQVLFNFDKARSVIRKEKRVFLFEGFMDVLAAWQSGVQNAIASMGTSLTNEQIQLLEKNAEEVILCYDGDTAGVEATYRGVTLLEKNSHLAVTVVQMPDRLDPDEYVRKHGTQAFYELAIHGQDAVFTFKMRYFRQQFNLNNEKEQLDYLQTLLQELTYVDSLIEQDRYLTNLSAEFKLSRETLQQQFRQIKQTQRQQHITTKPAHEAVVNPAVVVTTRQRQPLSQVEKAERLLLYRLFNDSFLNQRLKQVDFQFVHDAYQEIYVLYDTYLEAKGEFVLSDFVNILQQETIQRVSEIASLKVPEQTSERELQSLLSIFKRARLTEQINQKRLAQLEASQRGNQQLELELAVEILNLTKQMKQAEIY
ncbi:MAG: DNA primase [Enterococcus sp.]